MSKIIAEFSYQFQKSCENLSNNLLNNRDIHKSLLCGSPLTNSHLVQNLQQQALIHLFIVSGGHFLFLEKLLIKVKFPQFLHIPLLILYNLFTGFQAPGTRSLLFLLFTRGLKEKFLNLREDQILFLCGISLLSLFPKYFLSNSFLLSWTAALSLIISSTLLYPKESFDKLFLGQLLIALILLPWMCSFGNGHPLGVLSNIVIGPLIIFILFPLSALIIILPFLTSTFEFFVTTLDWILSHTSEVFITSHYTNLSMNFFWIYLLGLHLCFHIYQVKYWRKVD